MKKFIVAILIVILSATSAYARPTRHNPHQGGHGYHQGNNRPVVIKEKRHKSDLVATGIISGVAGFIIGSNLSSSYDYYGGSNYGSTTIVERGYNQPDCTTIYNRRQGTKTTTCRSRPQYDNVVIIQ